MDRGDHVPNEMGPLARPGHLGGAELGLSAILFFNVTAGLVSEASGHPSAHLPGEILGNTSGSITALASEGLLEGSPVKYRFFTLFLEFSVAIFLFPEQKCRLS